MNRFPHGSERERSVNQETQAVLGGSLWGWSAQGGQGLRVAFLLIAVAIGILVWVLLALVYLALLTAEAKRVAEDAE